MKYLVTTPVSTEVMDAAGLNVFAEVNARFVAERRGEPRWPFHVATVSEEELVVCPACHQTVMNEADIKQFKKSVAGLEVGVISIGFKCSLCGHVWGHEDS